MPNQVGDIVTFTVTPLPADTSNIYAWVWDFWDGSVDATVQPFTSKRLNVGGEPVNGTLNYTCRPVQTDGQSVVLSGTVAVNNPPTIVSPVSVSQNDGYFPFDTRVSVTAFDIEGQSLNFHWYDGDSYLGSGVASYTGDVTGTWTGNGTVIVDSYAGTTDYIDVTVSSDRTLEVFIVDGGTGTTALSIDLRGRELPPLAGGGGSGSVTVTEGTMLPTVRIVPGATVEFSVYGKDPLGGAVSFLWSFLTTNGWTTGPTTTPGTVVATADGGYQSTYTKDVSGETITGSNEKTVRALVEVTADSGTLTLPFDVVLQKNNPPTGLSLTATVNGASYNLGLLTPIAPGAVVELVASATDEDADVVDFYWQFTQPFTPTALQLWGGKVILKTDGYTTGQSLFGSVIAYDRVGGASSTLTVPAIPFS